MEKTNKDCVRVLLADDHPSLRVGLRMVLEKTPEIQIVGETDNGVDAQRLASELCPDVLLLDLRMPGPKPVEIATWMQTHCLQTAVLVLTAHDQDVHLAAMVAAGVAGFVVKDETPENLVEKVRRAARGEVLFNREQMARVRHWQEKVGHRWQSLTVRERKVLALVARGKTDKEIAQALNIEKKTVGNHICNILDKLEVASRTEAALWVLKEQLIDQDDIGG